MTVVFANCSFRPFVAVGGRNQKAGIVAELTLGAAGQSLAGSAVAEFVVLSIALLAANGTERNIIDLSKVGYRIGFHVRFIIQIFRRLGFQKVE